MSNPSIGQSSRPRKRRKHSTSATSSPSSSRQPSHFPPEVINPLSHPPNLLKQFQLAGLPETEHLPSIPDFPHRPLPRQNNDQDPSHLPQTEDEESAPETDLDPETGAETTDAHRGDLTPSKANKRANGIRRERRARERNIGPLVAILRRCIETGDTVRAKRAFGLLVRADIYGKRVDLRAEGYWGFGAEILMTQGSGPGSGDDVGGSGRRGMRWGSAANLHGFTRYFEELIQLYPYSRLHPNSLSAQDFYPVLFNAEIYNVVSEFEMAVERVDEDPDLLFDEEDEGGNGIEVDLDQQDENMELDDERGGGWDRPARGREQRIKAAKDKLRTDALEATRLVAGRMDDLMQSRPYNQSLEMMRLRGVIALFMGDLAMPFPPRTEDEEYDGQTRRDGERARAVKLFQKVLAADGDLDPWLREVVREHTKGEEDEDEEPSMVMPMFSSLPMR